MLMYGMFKGEVVFKKMRWNSCREVERDEMLGFIKKEVGPCKTLS